MLLSIPCFSFEYSSDIVLRVNPNKQLDAEKNLTAQSFVSVEYGRNGKLKLWEYLINREKERNYNIP